MARRRIDFGARPIWAVLLAVIALGLVAGAYGFYQVSAQRIRLEKYDELAAIGELKAHDIERWRQERLNDATKNMESSLFRKATETWLKEPANPTLRDEFMERLKLEQRTQGYADAFLLDLDGHILLSAKNNPGPVDAATTTAIAQAIEGKRAVLSEIFRSLDGTVYIDVVAPVPDANNRPIAVVVLRSDVETFLHPLIGSWPIPSRSAETVLVRKDGGDVLFLSDSRYQADATLSLRIPLARSDVPAVQAVLGKEGIFEGKDYRGVNVLADLRAVPGSAWFVVAKVDTSEILAEVNYRAWISAAFLSLLLLLTAAYVALLYRQRQVRIYRMLHASERDRHKVQELLRATLMGIGDGVVSTDERGCLTFANPVAEMLTGWPLAEAQGKPLAEVFHIVNAQTRERCENPVEKVLSSGEIVGLANHTVLIARDGRERQIADSGAPIRDANGNVIGVVLVFRDVTEEYRMRETLRESEERLRRTFDQAPIGMAVVALDHRFVRVNQALCRITGYSAEELTALTVKDITHPDDIDLGRIRQLIAGEVEDYEAEKRYVRKDGVIVWGRLSVRLLRDAEGQPQYLLPIVEDITERRQAEAEIRSGRDYIANVINTIGDPVFVKDERHRFVLVNDAMCAFTRSSRDAMIGRVDSDFFPKDQVDVFWEMDDRVLSSGRENVNEEVVMDARTGEARTVVTRKTRYVDPSGNRFIVGVIRDITERKWAEETLRESEKRLRAILDATPFPIALVDVEDNSIEFWSRSALTLFGHTAPSAAEWYQIAYPDPDYQRDVIERWKPALEKARQSAHAVNAGEYRVTCHDGSIRICELHAAFLLDKLVVTFNDITERKRAEEALKESEERFQQLFDNMADGVAVYEEVDGGRDFLLADMNRTGQFLSKVHLDEVVDRKVTEVFPAVERIGLLDVFRRVWRTGQPEHHPLKMYADGRIQEWVENYVYKLPSGLIVAIYSDTSEKHQAVEALRESEEKYRSLFESSHDALMTLAPPSWNFASANPATLNMFRADNEGEFVSCTPWTLSPERQPDGCVSAEKAQEMIETALRERSHFFEWTHKRLDGEEFPATVLLARVEQAGRVFLLATIRDITKLKHAEAERERLEGQLRQAQKMEAVGQLAGGVAHDFNNLLQVILGYVSVLEGRCGKDAATREALDAVRQAGERAADLTRQLLAFSRRQIIQPVNLDLNAVIQGVLTIVQRVIGENIDLRFVPGKSLGTVRADKGQMEQILMNLCVNARDAMPDGGSLAIETENVVLDEEYRRQHPWAAQGCCVLLSVADTGHGMDEATRAQIFEPFFTTKDVGQGTGLGLATVYGIVKQHDGLIHVYSEPGHGTVFKVYIPIVERPAEETSSEVEEPVVGGTETILVAEDEKMVRELVTRVLESAGYTVLTACDGEDALRVFEERRDDIDLALLDVMMPRLGGREVMDRIHAQRPRVRFLFSSGYSEDAIHTNFVIKEGLHLITKPYPQSNLLRAIREILDSECSDV